MAGSINVNQNNNKVILKDQNPNITITDNVHEKIVNVTPATTKIVEVRTPGPQGPKGNTGATGSLPSGILSSSIQIASDISGAFNSVSSSLASEVSSLIDATSSYALSSQISGAFTTVSSSLASEVSSLIDATSSYALSSQISGSWQGFITSSGILSSSAQISGSWQGFITSSGIISSSAFSSPSQGTVRATINGTQTDVDTGLQTGDGVEFLNITASAITASSIKANTMEVIHLTSSFITASTVITTGSNVFGDEASDTHTFIGDIIAKNNITGSGYISTDTNITASGNISASGTIVANKIKSLGSEVILENGHITASGNISASGTCSFYELELDGLVKHIGDTNTQFGFVQNDEFSVTTAGVEMLQIDGTGTTFNVSAQDRDFKVSGNGGNLFILNDGSNRAVFPTITGFRIGLADNAANATLEVGGNISSSGAINTNSHITSSGNISASGYVSASQFIGSFSGSIDNANTASYVENAQTASYITSPQTNTINFTGGITASNITASSIEAFNLRVVHLTSSFITSSTIQTTGSTVFGDEPSDSHKFIGGITGSNNISASGDLIIRNITSSGNISSSGQLRGNDLFLHAGSFDIQTGNTYTFNPSSGTGNIEFEVGSDDVIIKTNKRLEFQTTQGRLELGSISAPTNVTMSGNISGSATSTGSFGHIIGNFSGSINNAISSSYILANNIDQPFTNITASGDISSSGNIIADQVKASSFRALDTSLIAYMPTSTIIFGNDSDPIKIDGNGLDISAGTITTDDTFT